MNCGITFKVEGTDIETPYQAASRIKRELNTKLGTGYIKSSLSEIINSRVSDRQYLLQELALDIQDNIADDNDISVLKKRIRGTKVYISDTDKIDLCPKEEYNQFRKEIFGDIIISYDGIPIDILYKELSDNTPWIFGSEITHPADQLNELIRFMRTNSYREETQENTLEHIEILLWDYIKGKINMDLNFKYDVGQKVYVILNKDDSRERCILKSVIDEIALDRKGWHMHINKTRYGLNSKLVYIDKAEAEDYLEQLKLKEDNTK